MQKVKTERKQQVHSDSCVNFFYVPYAKNAQVTSRLW